MGNKEKATKIMETFTEVYGVNIERDSHIYSACMQMAQWKDEQFSKFLSWLDDNYVIRRFTDGEPMSYSELIDNFNSNNYERNTTKTD